MRPAGERVLASTAMSLALALCAGCGSSGASSSNASDGSSATTPRSTVTVTVPAPTPTTATTSTSSTSAAAPAPTSTAGGTTAPSTPRSAAEPAFTEQEQHTEGLAAAASTVRSLGYTPTDASLYHPDQTLRVLIGTATGSSDGYEQRAFFFVDGRYIGTDTKQPSARLSVVSQGETQVTIAYPLYRSGDPLCCPGAGQRNVTFELDNGTLHANGQIPPASSSSGLSRN